MLIGDPKNPRCVTSTSVPATSPIDTSFCRSSVGQLLIADTTARWPTFTALRLFSVTVALDGTMVSRVS